MLLIESELRRKRLVRALRGVDGSDAYWLLLVRGGGAEVSLVSRSEEFLRLPELNNLLRDPNFLLVLDLMLDLLFSWQSFSIVLKLSTTSGSTITGSDDRGEKVFMRVLTDDEL